MVARPAGGAPDRTGPGGLLPAVAWRASAERAQVTSGPSPWRASAAARRPSVRRLQDRESCAAGQDAAGHATSRAKDDRIRGGQERRRRRTPVRWPARPPLDRGRPSPIPARSGDACWGLPPAPPGSDPARRCRSPEEHVGTGRPHLLEPGSLIDADGVRVVGEDPEVDERAAVGEPLGRGHPRDDRPEATTARPAGGPDRRQVRHALERRAPGDRRGLTVGADRGSG